MTRTLMLAAMMCLVAHAADDAAVAPQVAMGLKPQAPSLEAEAMAITIPQMLSYQGKMTDTMGVPVPNGNYPMMFLLYTTPSGGSSFWSENQSVTTKDGLFSVLLGSSTPIGSMPDAGAVYLAMTVSGGPELTPRIRIVSSAFAYLSERAASADLLQGKDTSGFVRAGQTNAVTSTMVVDGTIAAADLGQMGASTGQVMKWTGSAWQPRNDSVGSGGGGTVTSVGQATGVVCSPNPITTSGTVRFDSAWGDARFVNEGQANSVTGAMIADGQVTSADIRDTTVNTAELKDGAVTMPKLNQAGATSGQVIKWIGSAWAPRNDSLGGGSDSAWVRAGSDSVLYTIRRLGIAKGGAGNALLGESTFTHVNLGVACTTGTSGQNYYYCTVGGGYDNAATDAAATIAGGTGNAASGYSATVGGGTANQAVEDYATVGGGRSGSAVGDYATVSGGRGCVADSAYATVGGGFSNATWGTAATVAGGSSNSADESYATVAGGYLNHAWGYAATVGGGNGNAADTTYATVGGGNSNDATSYGATVSGGTSNDATGEYATIGGGGSNNAAGYSAAVGGGRNNFASATYATVAGGFDNAAETSYATVAGGYGNDATGYAAAVGGGFGNTADTSYATVAGGFSGKATGHFATVSGGYLSDAAGYASTVGGGHANAASGGNATVPGGFACNASGYASYAAGCHAKARGRGSFVWSDSCLAGDSVRNTTDNRWVARARGGVYFYTNLGMTTGSYLATGGSSWNSVSDSLTKENFRPVDKKALLEALARMRVRDYNLKSQDPSIRHVGPVAQDFHKAFGFGESNTAINMEDADGVALAAIQALYEKVEAQQAEIDALKAKLAGK